MFIEAILKTTDVDSRKQLGKLKHFDITQHLNDFTSANLPEIELNIAPKTYVLLMLCLHSKLPSNNICKTPA